MIPLSGTPTVLIVDEDIGFVWWLGEIFHQLGCRVVPALSSREALSRIETAKLTVDLMVLNPALPEVSEMLKTLRRVRSLKIVLIQAQGSLARPDLDADAVIERPSAGDLVSRVDWTRTVRGLLAQIGTRAAS